MRHWLEYYLYILLKAKERMTRLKQLGELQVFPHGNTGMEESCVLCAVADAKPLSFSIFINYRNSSVRHESLYLPLISLGFCKKKYPVKRHEEQESLQIKSLGRAEVHNTPLFPVGNLVCSAGGAAACRAALHIPVLCVVA